jgi:hypothetical protein
MNTTANLAQAIFIAGNMVCFAFLGYWFIKIKKPTFKLFGISMALLAVVELCVLGVNMLWNLPILDFKSLQYLVYLYAILMLFATCSSSLRSKTSYYINIFLAFAAILVTGLFFFERTLNNATAYTINYYLSFDNAATLNIFSLTVALSLGMAALEIGQNIKNKTSKLIFESSFLVITISLVLNLIIYNDTARLIASIVQLLALLGICLYIYKNPKIFKSSS